MQWGAVGDVGMILESIGSNETVVGGTLPQRIASCLEVLGTLMSLPHAVVASMVLADKRRGPAAPQQDLVHAVANILGQCLLIVLLFQTLLRYLLRARILSIHY